MANEDLFGLKPKCILCTNEIPEDRLRFKAVTCNDEHAQLYARLRRMKTDNRACRFCHKPSTPNARRAFSRFRRWERENPEVARPEEYALLSAAGVSAKDIGKALGQAARNDIEIDLDLAHYNWGRTKKVKHEQQATPELDRCLEILKATVIPKEERNAIQKDAEDPNV